MHEYEEGVTNTFLLGSCNWSPKSVKTFGHTFNTHGAGTKNTKRLTGRAAGTGHPQGQWLNNDEAAEIMKSYADKIGGPLTIKLPNGVGQVIKPDGSILPTNWAVIIPKPGGGYRTGYPVLGP